MKRAWLIFLALLIVVGSGIAHGLCSDRWSTSQELPAAAARLTQLPLKIGDWEGTDVELDAQAMQRGEIVGSVVRRYVNRGTGQEMMVMLVCGKPGPIAVHTPDVCYQGAGYRLTGERSRQVVNSPSGEPAAFWKASFVKETFPARDELRIWWSWNGNGTWQVAGEPRIAFARYPVLHKLYVIYRAPTKERRGATDPTAAFVQQLLPTIQQTVLVAR